MRAQLPNLKNQIPEEQQTYFNFLLNGMDENQQNYFATLMKTTLEEPNNLDNCIRTLTQSGNASPLGSKTALVIDFLEQLEQGTETYYASLGININAPIHNYDSDPETNEPTTQTDNTRKRREYNEESRER